MSSYDDAVAALYRQPLAGFVAERKRLAGELKAAGDKAGAATFAKLARPPVSAWAVNQLWWTARDAFEALLAAAARVRDGDLTAAAAHRAALAKLRVQAAAILVEHGHGATEATLRRIALTLSAIGAIGSFDPDPPGALTDDRDPPGFEAMAGAADAAPRSMPAAAPAAQPDEPPAIAAPDPDALAEARRAREAAAAAREAAAAEAAAERARREAAEARRRERHRLETELARATAAAERQSRELERLRLLASTASAELAESRRTIAALEADLARLG